MKAELDRAKAKSGIGDRILVVPMPNCRFDLDLLRSGVSLLDRADATSTPSAMGHIYGWALMSCPGRSDFGVRPIGGRTPLMKSEVVHRTKHCTSAFSEAVVILAEHGVRVSRARILALGPGAEMTFHTDRENGSRPTWRIHVPIVTNENARLEWLVDGRVCGAHLAATGEAYFIKVSEPHRAVNRSKTETRYHFVCSMFDR